MDEGFWIYWEDADLGRRLHDKGWRVRYLPEARIVHKEHQSGTGEGLRLAYHFHRSLYRYYAKHRLGSPADPRRPYILGVLGVSLAAHAGIEMSRRVIENLMHKGR